ncbi:ATP-binding protein [Nocardia sp. NBC_01377]|uniref:ATP-binding protein n=1 Tax=Nocardia sp. NBC_01377 TaxID=2903595 RepID=UPI00386499D0
MSAWIRQRRNRSVPAATISDWFKPDPRIPRRDEKFVLVLECLYSAAALPLSGTALTRWKRLRSAAYAEARPVATTEPHARTQESPRVLHPDGDCVTPPEVGSEQHVGITALRRDIPTFVGRGAELDRILQAALHPSTAAPILAIDGMPGVGKTALVTRAAHLLTSQFPDGGFFVDLHTHSPGLAPAEPFDVLATLLTDLGIAPQYLPDTLETRRDLWRGRLADKRVLLVLDDARDHGQLEPLLPSGPGCLTMITSRSRLVALDGATPVSLDTPAPEDAAAMFYALAGRDVDTDRDLVAEIVHMCGNLPLAVALLGGRMAHHPTWSVATVAADLRAADDRLDELDTGQRAVRLAFTTSYEDLPPSQQLLFRQIGLHPGPDFDHAAVAALTDTSPSRARKELDVLYTHHLVDEIAPGRYRQHDLLREYARTLADRDLSDDRTRAFDRLADYYQRTAFTAISHAHPAPDRGHRSPRAPDPVVTDYVSATVWMRRERPNLLACLLAAASRNELHRAIQLANAVIGEVRLYSNWQLEVVGAQPLMIGATSSDEHPIQTMITAQGVGAMRFLSREYTEIVDALQKSLATHTELDLRTRGSALRALARVHSAAGDRPAAIEALEHALALCRNGGQQHMEASLLNTLGWVVHLTGDYPKATTLIETALAISREHGQSSGVAAALNSLGWINLLTRKHTIAAELLNRSRDIYRQAGNQVAEAFVTCTLGWLRFRTGEHQQTAIELTRALQIYRDLGNLAGEAFALSNLGCLQHLTGDTPSAVIALRESATIYSRIANPAGEAGILNTLGLIYALDGDTTTGEAIVRRALNIHRTIGDHIGQTEALSNLGWINYLTGETVTANEMLCEAVTIARRAGHVASETEALRRLRTLRSEYP